MPLPELTLRARYVFPVDAAPIVSGCVRIGGDRITYVGPTDRQPDWDLGNAAIVPGFVNSHTHLDLSGLRAKDLAGANFTDWIRGVIEARRGQGAKSVAHAVERGIDASVAAGTTLLGDISNGGASWRLLARSPLRATVFCEVLGLSPRRAEETAKTAGDWLKALSSTTAEKALQTEPAFVAVAPAEMMFEDGTRIEPLPPPDHSRPVRQLVASLSPHAPYSAHPLLFDWAAAWASQSRTPLCSHLAETKEELQLLQSRDGPLRSFLQSIGAWSDAWHPPGPNPMDYLTGRATQNADWVIAHGNFLTDAEIASLAAAAGSDSPRRAVVYCPRTHAYFGHPTHPYSKMLDAGLTVCLGTDSLASTPTLSILDEMRFLHRRDAGLPGDILLRMATLSGAWALRREHVCGSLTPGKYADLAVVRLPDRDEWDPHRLLLEFDQPVIRTVLGGRLVYQLR
jgi:cytosine/adenosine deaminase-related metal-dependent hydrolase